MRPLQLILNDLSLDPPPESLHVGRQWMQGLQETAARAIERGFQEVLLVPQGFLSAPLGEGYSFSHWLDDSEVELEVRQLIQDWVSWGPFLDDLYLDECGDLVEVYYEREIGAGLSLACSRDHAVVSVSREPWQAEEDALSVVVHRRDAADQEFVESVVEVRNLHCPASVERSLRWIAGRCCVKPRYDNPGTHDPGSGVFRGGGAMTTILPVEAEEVYETAIPSDPKDGMSSWWGQNHERYLYRYQASWPGAEPVAHWNGTTDPSSERAIEDREIPVSIRDAFPDRRR